MIGLLRAARGRNVNGSQKEAANLVVQPLPLELGSHKRGSDEHDAVNTSENHERNNRGTKKPIQFVFVTPMEKGICKFIDMVN